MQYIEIFKMKIFSRKTDLFLSFAQNLESNEYPQSIFVAKIRKIGKSLYIPVLLYKSGVQRGIHYTDMFS